MTKGSDDVAHAWHEMALKREAGEIDRLRADIARHMTIANDAIARIDEAVAAEREACAKACVIRAKAEWQMRDENRKNGCHDLALVHGDRASVLIEQAAAIRARGEG